MSCHSPLRPDHMVPLTEAAEMTDEEIESVPEQDEQKDNAPFSKTYIAVDGIEAEDIDKEHKESIERTITDFFLTNGYPIESVRIISDTENVIEIES